MLKLINSLKQLLKKLNLILSENNIQIASLGSFMLINALAAFIAGVLIVQTFGITKEIEIYFSAAIIILTIDRLFTLGAINEVILPIFLRIKEDQSIDDAMQYLSIFKNLFILSSIIILGILLISSDFILSTILVGFTYEEVSKSVNLFNILILFLPLKMFNGISAIPFRANKIYNVHEKTGLLNRIILIIILLIIGDTYGVSILIFGTILGICLRFIYILFLYKKYEYKYRLIINSDQFSPYEILKTIRYPFLDTFAYIFNWWVMIAGLTVMTDGLLAIFNYVQQLYGNLFSVLMGAMGTIFLTEISSREKKFNKEIISNYLYKASFISFFLLTLAIVVSRDFLEIIWSSEKFDESNIFIAYILLLISFATLIMSMTENIYQKINISRGNTDLQMLGKFFIIILTSILFILTAKEYGLHALILTALFKGIALLIFASLLCKYKNPDNFYVYEFIHIIKAITLVCISILLTYLLFKSPITTVLNNILLIFILKSVLTVIIFFIFNKILNVYDLRKIIST